MGVIGILGTIHGDDDFRQEKGYTLEMIKEAIVEFKPDIIYGEVRPEDWSKYSDDNTYSGYLGPSEYRRLIIPYCKSEGIEFEPVDWFEDDLVDFDYLQSYSETEKEAIIKELDKKYEKIWEVGKKSILPLNSFELDALIMQKQEWLNTIDPIVYNVNWIARNQIMVERIRKVIEKNSEKRILCTVGAEHNYYYYNELKKLNLNLVYPLK